jgi:integrase
VPIYKTTGKRDGLRKYLVRVNFMDESGGAKQVTRTAYGLEAARDLERALYTEVKEKKENPTTRKTVQQLFEEYIAVKQYETRKTTYASRLSKYVHYIKDTLGEVRIDRLTASVLQGWKLGVEKTGLLCSTKKEIYSLLRAILNCAVKMEYITKNPLFRIGNFRDVMSIKPDASYYTPEEFERFIGVARSSAQNCETNKNTYVEWNYYVFFAIAYYTGLRIGEILALKWGDISGEYLSVRRSMSIYNEETPPKNRSSMRTLQIPKPLMVILNEQKRRHKELMSGVDGLRVCGGTDVVTRVVLAKRNRTYAEVAGVKRIRIHDFRHSHASLLASEGINIQEVARRLGHAKVEMTWNTYSHLYPKEEEKAIAVLNRVGCSVHDSYTI